MRSLEAAINWVNCFDHGDMTQPFGGSGVQFHSHHYLDYFEEYAVIY